MADLKFKTNEKNFGQIRTPKRKVKVEYYGPYWYFERENKHRYNNAVAGTLLEWIFGMSDQDKVKWNKMAKEEKVVIQDDLDEDDCDLELSDESEDDQRDLVIDGEEV